MSTQVTIGATSGGNGTAKLRVEIDETGSEVHGQRTTFMNPLYNGFSPRDWQSVKLASGDNTFTLPTSTTGTAPGAFVFQAPSSNTTVTLTVRDNTQTGGATIARNGVHVRTFDVANSGTVPTSIIINASATLSGCLYGWL